MPPPRALLVDFLQPWRTALCSEAQTSRSLCVPQESEHSSVQQVCRGKNNLHRSSRVFGHVLWYVLSRHYAEYETFGQAFQQTATSYMSIDSNGARSRNAGSAMFPLLLTRTYGVQYFETRTWSSPSCGFGVRPRSRQYFEICTGHVHGMAIQRVCRNVY